MALSNPCTGQELINEINNKLDKAFEKQLDEKYNKFEEDMTKTFDDKIQELTESNEQLQEDLEKRVGDSLGALVTTVNSTLYASKWSNSLYSFETEYPSATYDIDIALRGEDLTDAKQSAYDKARIVGYGGSNVLKAFGAIPIVDIPVVLRVVKK